MAIKSHNDKSLLTHLNNVKNIGLSVFDSKKNLNLLYPRNEVRKLLSIILFYHDFGKASKYFQAYLNENNVSSSELSNHSDISALYAVNKVFECFENKPYLNFFAYCAFMTIGKHHGNLVNYSFLKSYKIKRATLEEKYSTINFEELNEKKIAFEIIFKNYKIIKRAFKKKTFDKEQNLQKYMLLNFLFSILIYADKIDASNNSLYNFSHNFSYEAVNLYKYYKFKNSPTNNINSIRNEIYNTVQNNLIHNFNNSNIFSINVPTGAGKTLTAVNASFNALKHFPKFKRIIYAFPFTTLIEQTEKIIKEILTYSKFDPNYTSNHSLTFDSKKNNSSNIDDKSCDNNDLSGDNDSDSIKNSINNSSESSKETAKLSEDKKTSIEKKMSSSETENTKFYENLLVHHHLSEMEININDETKTGSEAAMLMENWDKPLILTTFWQLFYSLITGRNKFLRKFHNLADSIIILDEIQSVKAEYWTLIENVLNQLCENLGCKIIVMTATLPKIFSTEEFNMIHLISKSKREEYFKAFNRYEIRRLEDSNEITEMESEELDSENLVKSDDLREVKTDKSDSANLESSDDLGEVKTNKTSLKDVESSNDLKEYRADLTSSENLKSSDNLGETKTIKTSSENFAEIRIEELVSRSLKIIDREENPKILFVFNTIGSSLDFYKRLKNEVEIDSLYYLSSNIIPIEKKNRVKEIRSKLKSSESLICVSTQVIEAGADLDFDIVFRDKSPMDSIVQTAGRCNRENKKDSPGRVYVFSLHNEKNRNFSSFIYGSIFLDLTNEFIKNKEIVSSENSDGSEDIIIKESELLSRMEEYYSELSEKKSFNKGNKILSNMKSLNYKEVINEFVLYENIKLFSVFVEIDENAKILWEKYCENRKIKDLIERRDDFMKFRHRFYQYVVNIGISNHTKGLISELQRYKEEDFLYIKNDMTASEGDDVGKFYQKDTGIGFDENDVLVF